MRSVESGPERTPRDSVGSERTPRVRRRSSLSQGNVSMMSLSTMKKAPHWSMSGKPRTSSVDRRPLAPDPGSYTNLDPSVTSKMERSPRASFGAWTSSRDVLRPDKEAGPGPGSYNHQARDDLGQIVRQTSASLSTPRNRDRPSRANTPDPGSYISVDPQSTSKMGRSPSYGFASRVSRFPMLKERAPGPGAYTSAKVDQQGGTNFVRGPPRKRDQTRAASPDPGTYVPVDPSTTSRMSRSPRAIFDSRSSPRAAVNGSNPGPGHYAHKDLLADTSGGSFLRSPQRAELKTRTETPDPGVYTSVDPSVTSKMPKQAGYGFGDLRTGRLPNEGTENGMDKADEVGDENGTTNGIRSPRGSVGSPSIFKQDIPGPGTYEVVGAAPAIAASSPRWGFGNSEARARPLRSPIVSQTPGPGTYIRTTIMGVGPKFSMRGRSDDRLVSTPGPGSYGGLYTQFIP